MRQISEELKAAFSKRFAIEPLFVIKINWPDGALYYSTKEIGSIYGLVKEFSNFESLLNGNAVGESSNIIVTFIDYFGHLKQKFDTVDLSTLTVQLYLTEYSITDTSKFLQLQTGLLKEPEWEEGLREFKVTIETADQELEAGYFPSVDDLSDETEDYAYYEKGLVENVWPMVYGSVKNMPLSEVAIPPSATLAEDVVYTGDHVYTVPLEEDHNLPLNIPIVVMLSGQDRGYYAFRIPGQVILIDDAPFFQYDNSEVILNWYEDLPITWLGGETIEVEGGASINIGGDSFRVSSPDVWLQYLVVRLSGPTGFKTGIVINQTGDICELDRGGLGNYDTLVWARKIETIVKKFSAGTKLILYNWAPSNRYIVSLNEGVTVDALKFRIDGGYKEIAPEFYDVISTDGVDGNALFAGGHPPCTYIEFGEKAFLQFFTTFSSRQVGDRNVGVVADVTSIYNTDKLVIQNLLDLHSGNEYTINDAEPIACNFAYLEAKNIFEFFREILWQNRKAIQATGLTFDLVTRERRAPIYTFDQTNIHNKSIVLNAFQDIKTVLRVAYLDNNWDTDDKRIVKNNNVDLYGKIIDDQEIYMFDRDRAEEITDRWIFELSSSWKKAKFKTYLEAAHIQPWDWVRIEFGSITLYDPTEGSPLENTLEGDDGALWASDALVEEVNITNDLLELVVRLPIKVGEL